MLNPDWSAAGYLENAQTFPEFFAWFVQPEILPWTNMLNEWGLTLIGVSLILGAFVRWSALAGILLMGLYYVPVLSFPYVDHGYIVDNHIIYILVLALLALTNAGYKWGFDRRLRG